MINAGIGPTDPQVRTLAGLSKQLEHEESIANEAAKPTATKLKEATAKRDGLEKKFEADTAAIDVSKKFIEDSTVKLAVQIEAAVASEIAYKEANAVVGSLKATRDQEMHDEAELRASLGGPESDPAYQKLQDMINDPSIPATVRAQLQEASNSYPVGMGAERTEVDRSGFIGGRVRPPGMPDFSHPSGAPGALAPGLAGPRDDSGGIQRLIPQQDHIQDIEADYLNMNGEGYAGAGLEESADVILPGASAASGASH
jgi:hypothetical protein